MKSLSFNQWMLLGGLTIVAIGFIVYYPALNIGFWADDYEFIDAVGRSDLASYLNSYFNPFAQWHWYRPIQCIFWWIAFTLFHDDARGYHAMQLALHVFNSILLLSLVAHFSRRWYVGFGAALIYLTLPFADLAVFWVAVADPLVALFYLLALRLWIAHLERGGRLWFLATVVTVILAMLSKEIAVTLPIALFLADRLLVGGPFDVGLSVKRYAPFVLFLGIYGAIEWNIITHGVFTTSLGYGLGAHIVPAALLHLSTLSFPWVDESALRYLWLTILCTGVLVAAYKHQWRMLFLPAFIVLTLLPVLPFQLNMASASRYLYLPLMGSALGASLILSGAWRWIGLGVAFAFAPLIVWQSLVIADQAQSFGGTARQTRLQFRPIFQTLTSFQPDTYLYFVNPPLNSATISGMFVLRYGRNAVVAGNDQGRIAELRDHKSAIVFYQDDDNNWREQKVAKNLSSTPTPHFPVRFNSIQLDGVELVSDQIHRGGALIVIFYWRAMKEILTDYTVSAHIVDEDNRIVASADSQPQNGRMPTSAWKLNEMISDGIAVPIPDNAPLGKNFRLEVGLYDLSTLERLSIVGSDGQATSDAIAIQPIRIIQ